MARCLTKNLKTLDAPQSTLPELFERAVFLVKRIQHLEVLSPTTIVVDGKELSS